MNELSIPILVGQIPILAKGQCRAPPRYCGKSWKFSSFFLVSPHFCRFFVHGFCWAKIAIDAGHACARAETSDAAAPEQRPCAGDQGHAVAAQDPRPAGSFRSCNSSKSQYFTSINSRNSSKSQYFTSISSLNSSKFQQIPALYKFKGGTPNHRKT